MGEDFRGKFTRLALRRQRKDQSLAASQKSFFSNEIV